MYYFKKRRWYAAPLVIAGNLYLGFLNTHVRFLSQREWLKWEPLVYTEIVGKPIRLQDGHTLILPHLQGDRLSDILRARDKKESDKMGAIKLSVRTLEALHKCQIRWPDGVIRPFSHGDVTGNNIICDMTSHICHLFDFETLHHSKMSNDWRQSDDLRALIYSAAEYIEPYLFRPLCHIVVRNYGNKKVLAQLKHLIKSSTSHPNVYYLAQSRLQYEKKVSLDIILLGELDRILNDMDSCCTTGQD